MRDVEPIADIEPLLVAWRPHHAMDELIGDVGREIRPVLLSNEMKHEIEDRGPAGACHELAVDHEQFGADLDVRKFLLERVDTMPMQGRPRTLQQSRPRQYVSSCADGADHT